MAITAYAGVRGGSQYSEGIEKAGCVSDSASNVFCVHSLPSSASCENGTGPLSRG
jgi:hypothetical protein